MPSCPEEPTLRQFLSGALDAVAEKNVDAHLAGCLLCQRKLEAAVRLPDALQALLAMRRGSPGAPTDVSSSTGEPAAAAEAAPELPGYEVVAELGKGGMGVVYRARDVRLRREVAVKVLAAALAGEPQARQRFVEEAHIAAQLQHPGIAAVHELGALADGRPFLAMKLVKGQTLAEQLRLRAAPQEELPRLVQVFAQVCQAVAYAHSHGVIHRDLKPANIMVGAFGEVQVMDWGLAKVLTGTAAPATTEAEATAPGTVIATPRDGQAGWQTHGALGTWAYMAPEQARGQAERVDARADVFALGALLCEVLTGRPPYQEQQVRRQAEDADLAEALTRLDGCGADRPLVELARACLAARPEDRPADAGAVAAAVAAYQADVQERLRRAELERAEAEVRAAEGRKRRRLRLGLGAAALAALVLASGGGWLWQKRRADRRGDVEAALKAAADHRDGFRWKRARQALDYAEERLGAGGPADLRQALTQADADLALARRLDDIRLKKATLVEGKFYNVAAADREYEEAFRAAGLGSPGDDVAAVAARVKGSAIRVQLLAALDDWATETWKDKARLAWLLDVARQADEPGRGRFRDPQAWQSAAALRRLAGEAATADVPPALFVALTQRLGAGRPHLPLLRAAVARRPTDFWAHFSLANALVEEAPKEAVGFYWAALALRPDNATAHYNLGIALYASKDVQGAMASYRAAVAADPKYAKAHYNLGLALKDSGNLRGAIASFRAAILADPKFAQAHTNLGVALKASGDVKGAMASYRAAIAADPRLAQAHTSLGVALYASKDVQGAMASYRAAIAADPRHAGAHNNLGLALYDSKDVQGALASYRAAIAADPRHADAHYNLGLALVASGDPKGAMASYRAAIAADPRHADAHYNLGVALVASGDVQGAVASFRAAIAADPKYAQAHYNLGLTLYASKDVQGAMASYRAAIAADPRDAQAHGALGQALRDSGQFAEAISSTRRAIGLLPADDPRRPFATRQLQQCEALLALDQSLTAVLQGQRKPANAAEMLTLAHLCARYKKRHAAAARFYADAFTARPAAADDLRQQHRYNAACAAALAAASEESDAATLGESERRYWRRQALAWLRADLAAWQGALANATPQDRQAAAKPLAHWQSDPDFASVREPAALAWLPLPEALDWAQLWADVAHLLRRAHGGP